MEIQVKNNILLIKPESLFEEKILNSEYFQKNLKKKKNLKSHLMEMYFSLIKKIILLI